MIIKIYCIHQIDYRKKRLLYLVKEFQWLLSLVNRLRPDLYNYFKNKDKFNLILLILLLIEESNEKNHFIKSEFKTILYSAKNKKLINKNLFFEKKFIRKPCTILRKKINTYRLIPTIKKDKVLFSIYIFSKKLLHYNTKIDTTIYNSFRFNIFYTPLLKSFKHYSIIKNYKNCYNIFYFPEKLKDISDKNLFFCNLANEIWVCSRLNYDILASLCLRPVLIIPYGLKAAKQKDKDKKSYFLLNSVPKNRLIFIFNTLRAINQSILY